MIALMVGSALTGPKRLDVDESKIQPPLVVPRDSDSDLTDEPNHEERGMAMEFTEDNFPDNCR
jgi:hypothetical protein